MPSKALTCNVLARLVDLFDVADAQDTAPEEPPQEGLSFDKAVEEGLSFDKAVEVLDVVFALRESAAAARPGG
ncbi:hypothetical protein T484DRAFT_1802628 [Baffinella frigidus]|nr:hypothetical protein T484DRAFT_1802628 [Cryptophyta sp. CCMP2293]